MDRGVVVVPLAVAVVCWLHSGVGVHSGGHVRPVPAQAGAWFQAPRFSPQGDELIVSGPGYRGLWRLPVTGGRAIELTDEAGAGIDARVLSDGAVAYTTSRDGARYRVVLDPVTGATKASRALMDKDAAVAVDNEGQIFVRTGERYRQVATGDQYFGAVSSPDSQWVAFVGLVTGVWVYDRVANRLHHVGRGTAPSWSADSRRLVYERTLDDGHKVVASELYTWSRDQGSRAITNTPRRIERRPSFSPDGTRVAFDDDRGQVFVAEVRR